MEQEGIVAEAVPFPRGPWTEGVFVLGSVAEWDTEASVIVSDIDIHNICGVEVSLLSGSCKSAR